MFVPLVPAPPVPPPILRVPGSGVPPSPIFPAAGPVQYSIGEPTDEEQLYLELLNRSRANPPAEGVRLATTTDTEVRAALTQYAVDTDLMKMQFNVIPAVPPLAMNALLTAAAREHSADMLANVYQGHDGTDGSDPFTRMIDHGYIYSSAGENVYAAARSVFHGHAGFNIDWGSGPGGMQDPPGHRINIHHVSFREVGIGVVDGSKTTPTNRVGPQLVTQDFGTAQSGGSPFITGVVYYDLNGNGFYDLGEGIGGIRVDVAGANYFAVTANSGGYAVPVTGNGAKTVTFLGGGLMTTQRVVNVSNGNNVKADLVPVYSPPTISGPNPALVNGSNGYSFTAVAGASSYQWKQTRRAPFTAIEGAENGLANVTVTASAGYNVIASDVQFTGSKSFHLAMPVAEKQILTLNRLLRPGANGQWIFAERLGVASSNQVARAQISTNGGVTWQDVWSRAGTVPPGSGQAGFAPVTNSLSAYAGQEIMTRFVYDFSAGNYYTGTNAGVGLYLDDISFTNTEELTSPATNNVPTGTNFVFTPSQAGDYVLRARAFVSNHYLDYGPPFLVTANTNVTPVTLRITQTAIPTAGQLQIDFQVLTGSPAGFTVERTTALPGGWGTDTGATISTITPGSRYRAVVSTAGANRRFYRIKAQ